MNIVVRLCEFDMRFGAYLAGFGLFMGSGGCTIQ